MRNSIALASLAMISVSFKEANAVESVIEEIFDDFSIFGGKLACNTCSFAFDHVGSFLKNPTVLSSLEACATGICDIASYIKASNDTVCHGAVHSMGDILMPVIADSILSPTYICDEWWGVCDTPHLEHEDLGAYIEKLLESKPEAIKGNDFMNKLYQSLYKDGKLQERDTIKVVQIADPHLDFEYTEGTISDCSLPQCCRASSGFTSDPARQAGYWGNLNCDIPHHTLKNMLEFINDDIHPDMVFWTGDNSAHNIWDNSWDEIIDYTQNITETIKSTFGEDSDITVFPIEGNHDTWPVNVQSFDKPYQNKAINEYKNSWKGWLTDESLELFSKWGYYSQDLVLLNGKKIANTKILGLNTQTCNNLNWYLLGQRDDPGNELAWLEAELAAMEESGELAIIMAHIPPADCLHEWGARFRALMDRYQHVVRFSTYGHVHKEDPRVVKAVEDNKYIAMQFSAPSATTMSGLLPAFNLFTLDAELMIPLEIETYFFDIDRANGGDPTWALLHDYTSTYNMSDLSPQSFGLLFENIKNDYGLAKKFDVNRHRRDDGIALDEYDMLELYCTGTSTEQYQYNECKNVTDISFSDDPVTAAFNMIINPWVKTVN